MSFFEIPAEHIVHVNRLSLVEVNTRRIAWALKIDAISVDRHDPIVFARLAFPLTTNARRACQVCFTLASLWMWNTHGWQWNHALLARRWRGAGAALALARGV
jgi:hypothetical protein